MIRIRLCWFVVICVVVIGGSIITQSYPVEAFNWERANRIALLGSNSDTSLRSFKFTASDPSKQVIGRWIAEKLHARTQVLNRLDFKLGFPEIAIFGVTVATLIVSLIASCALVYWTNEAKNEVRDDSISTFVKSILSSI